LCHQMPPIWHPLLPVKMSDDEFTEREVYFSLNGNNKCELGGANEFFLDKLTVLLNARSADFISKKEGHKTVLLKSI